MQDWTHKEADSRLQPRPWLGTPMKLPRLSLCHPYTTLTPYPNPAIQVEVGWMHKEVMVMGRSVMQPRLVAYQADHRGLAYTYSRLTLSPDAWTPAVLAVKVRLLMCICSRLPLALRRPACRGHAQVVMCRKELGCRVCLCVASACALAHMCFIF